ncbi:NADH dehydrogenase [Dysgonomonas sp. PFB1-18]|uniref:NAD(P)/FAD-dependent oxidoreductase n=1 Tax=unclassified Dysgonomonas TaxID=2630389 RepID=UPI002473DDB9|nr:MULTISPECIES: NAD(P)/FAD-dependent oxidoreductase [unclassified Dysgonomonas]MDH6311039.1 NADH dehydrogenase [Dysgonomonas sp. PF1-14]MDH6337888.1 NADH dehydrogenase [Dysgonomonas sp. PF1-16]MDH6382587.1 NADH dehydrogenase [Dysgonomonas sp. PFB1-18]MDH6398020.1 NADH dehydrogenase [Dysgonomonas sp. PF1-23]
MNYIANIPEAGYKKRLVIIGGGFAGLELAKKIDKKQYQVVLIDKNNYYQFQPLFYQVATGGLEPSSISYPHRKNFQRNKNFHFRMCEAQSVDPEKRIVKTNIGDINYDHLVISTGCDTNYFGNESLKETTFALKSVSESLLLRNRILLSFEEALSAKDEGELKEILSFVIVGGGATGVELAGSLADMKKSILPKDYPEIDFSKMEIHLVDASPRLLFAMSEEASAKAAKTLKKRGVIIHQDISVKSFEKPYVEISNGTKLRSRNVFWVAGVKPNSLAGLDESAYNRGRLAVNEFNQVNGYEDIFALGDTALLISDNSPKGHPQVAQVALQMANNLAKNLNNTIKAKEWEKFTYADRGSLATIGRNAAVADLGKFRFGGRFAWWLWLWVHILSIVGMRNKVSVFIDWVWSYLNYDVSLRLFIRPKFNKMYKEE